MTFDGMQHVIAVIGAFGFTVAVVGAAILSGILVYAVTDHRRSKARAFKRFTRAEQRTFADVQARYKAERTKQDEYNAALAAKLHRESTRKD